MSGNKISQIPKGILKLPKLRTLHLSYNGITDVDELWNPNILTDLEVVDLSNNQIMDISDNVYYRAGLNYLNIENNNMTRIPTILGFMRLSGLKVDGNPLKLIKRAVIDKGSVAILDYLRTKHVGDPPQPQPQKEKPKPPQYAPEQPNYPYETEHKLVEPPKQQHSQADRQQEQERQRRVKELEAEIKGIQYELDNNMGMNNMVKTQKKKQMQALMIERNKLMKNE